MHISSTEFQLGTPPQEQRITMGLSPQNKELLALFCLKLSSELLPRFQVQLFSSQLHATSFCQ